MLVQPFLILENRFYLHGLFTLLYTNKTIKQQEVLCQEIFS